LTVLYGEQEGAPEQDEEAGTEQTPEPEEDVEDEGAQLNQHRLHKRGPSKSLFSASLVPPLRPLNPV